MNYLAEKISGPRKPLLLSLPALPRQYQPVAADASADTGNQAATPVTDTGTPAPAAVAPAQNRRDAARRRQRTAHGFASASRRR